MSLCMSVWMSACAFDLFSLSLSLTLFLSLFISLSLYSDIYIYIYIYIYRNKKNVYIQAYVHMYNSEAAAKHWFVRWRVRATYAGDNDNN
jgi:hypothetical protein